jgi:plasmid stability protein
MAAILIRGLDEKLKRTLRLRAAENGRSMEEEARQMLRAALGVPSPEEEARKELDALVARELKKQRQRGR